MEHKCWKLGRGTVEVMADLMPETKFYKAFNTIGVEHMDPTPGSLLNTKSPVMLFCGPEEDKETISTFIEHAGWTAKYVGGLKYSRNLEAIAELWISMSLSGHHLNFHFNYVEGEEVYR